MRYDLPDAWVEGVRCTSGHLWQLRGGTLHGDGACFGITYTSELTGEQLTQLIACWLNGDPVLDSNLHESVRRVLQSYRVDSSSSA
jgi:hypothetical protein